MGFTDVGQDNQPVSFQQTFEQKRLEHREELQRKEDEMRQTFVLRVKEKETELKEVEKDVSMCVCGGGGGGHVREGDVEGGEGSRCMLEEEEETENDSPL